MSAEPTRKTGRSKAFRAIVMAIVMSVGVVVAVESPALAVGACSPYPPLGPCIDYQGGAEVQGDFYLNVAPSATYFAYRVAIVSNGKVNWRNLKTNFTHGGRHCCWRYSTDGYPNSWHTVFTRVNVYNAGGSVINVIDSPPINVLN